MRDFKLDNFVVYVGIFENVGAMSTGSVVMAE